MSSITRIVAVALTLVAAVLALVDGQAAVAASTAIPAVEPASADTVARPAPRPFDVTLQTSRASRPAPQRVRHLATASQRQLDRVGVSASLYRGKYFRSSIEQVRRCIVKRESTGRYDAVNVSGGYFGAYQMTDALADGATWMMLKEHRKLLGAKKAKRLLADLRRTPASEWNRYWQDAAFATIANWEHTGSGLRHWAGGRWHC